MTGTVAAVPEGSESTGAALRGGRSNPALHNAVKLQVPSEHSLVSSEHERDTTRVRAMD